MRATTVLIALTLVTGAVLGAAVEPVRADDCEGGAYRGRRCSTPPGGGGKALITRTLAGARRLEPGERIVVPIVYHVIYDTYVPFGTGPGETADDLEHAPPVALVELQTPVLNRAFQGTAFSFSTADVQLHSFVQWRSEGLGYPPLADVVKMIRKLNAARPGVLHVFLMRKDDEETAAPPDTKRMYEKFRRPTDGIVMPWDYLPYEPSLRPVENPNVPLDYPDGETLVHLVGHYLGLLHTYEPWPGVEPRCERRCAQISDLVRDTPVHLRTPTESCVPADSCTEYPGLDPVHNYMTAEPDVCTSEFTAGQIERMERMVRAFRPHFIVPAPASPP